MADPSELPAPPPKSLGRHLYERVILSYKSTLLGLLLAAGVEVVNYLQASPDPKLHMLATGLGLVFALLRAEGVGVPPPSP